VTRRVDKPWGHEEIWAHTDRYVGKVLFILAGHSLSLQYHNEKEETIRMLRGQMDFEMEEPGQSRRTVSLDEGDVVHIRPKTIHRMTAVTDCEVLEVSTPELDDVVRLEDRYGRTGTSEP